MMDAWVRGEALHHVVGELAQQRSEFVEQAALALEERRDLFHGPCVRDAVVGWGGRERGKNIWLVPLRAGQALTSRLGVVFGDRRPRNQFFRWPAGTPDLKKCR